MVAGETAGETRRLRDRDWIKIGNVALMHLDLDLGEPVMAPCRPAARRLGRADHGAVTELIGEVFGVGSELAGVAIAGVTDERADQALWGAFDRTGALVSCLATARVAGTTAVWSMATKLSARRRGYGAAALRTALAAAAEEGATSSLLSSSPVGEPLYRALGYRELERWEQWSRPRWALARA
jgi:GNAT superfamily N-acetyltransferase